MLKVNISKTIRDKAKRRLKIDSRSEEIMFENDTAGAEK